MPGELHRESNEAIKEIIKAFLRKYKFLHEYRLQKLVYILDLYSIEENGDRQTNLDYKPYMYGSYSEELGQVLDELVEEEEIGTKPDMQHGKVTTAYILQEEDTEDPNQRFQALVDKIHSATRSLGNDELANWSKETWLYENTEYGNEMDFYRYKSHIKQGIIKSDLRRNFPEIFE